MSEDEEKPAEQPAKHTVSISRRFIFAAGGALVVILVVVAFSFGWPQTAWRHATARQPAKKPSFGYTLTPPQGWDRLTPPPQGTSVAFASKQLDSDADGQLRAYIAVQTSTLSGAGQKLNFAQITNAYLQQLAQNYQNFKQLAADTTAVEGQPAMLLNYSFTQDKAPVTSDTLILVSHGTLYDVSGEALTSAWSQHAKDIEGSLLTFRP